MMLDSDTEFQFALAAHLGMTVSRMQAEMTVDEYRGWIAYFELKRR